MAPTMMQRTMVDWDDRQWMGCRYQLSTSRLAGCRWSYILRFGDGRIIYILSEELRNAMWTLAAVDAKADGMWTSQLEPVVPHLVHSRFLVV